MGYFRAGLQVVGVDVRRHVHYPFDLHQGDCIGLLKWLLEDPENNEFDAGKRWYCLRDFAAVHISPPCQAASSLTQGTNQHLRIIALTARSSARTWWPRWRTS